MGKWYYSRVQAPLDKDTAALAKGHDAVVLFVNDDCSTEVLFVFCAGRHGHHLQARVMLTSSHQRVSYFMLIDVCMLWMQVVDALHDGGIRFVAMRCAGFDKVDVAALNERGMKVSG